MTNTSPHSENTASEFTIDELAQAAGTTVRNVRAYQERGLLPPPDRRGRIGIYNEMHLARLRIIGPMLERGYSLANVAELIEAWEKGHDIGKLLGLEAALTSPWTDEVPQDISKAQLNEIFGDALTPEAMAAAIEMGVVTVIDNDTLRISSMKLMRAGALLSREGVPAAELLKIIQHMRGHIEHVANELVQLVVRYIFDRYGKGGLPPPEDVPRLAELIWQLRPMVIQAVDYEVARAMEKSTNKFRGEKLSNILDHLHKKD